MDRKSGTGKLPLTDGRACLQIEGGETAARAGDSLKTKKPQRLQTPGLQV